jgi:hypothetical protein
VAVARSWALFQAHTASLAAPVLAINVTMMALAFGLALAARVERRQAVTVAIESRLVR